MEEGNEILRVIPRLNEEVNEEWLSERGGFSYDGFKRQRLGVPLVRDAASGLLREATWEEAPSCRLGAAVTALACAESMVSLRELMHRLGHEGPLLA